MKGLFSTCTVPLQRQTTISHLYAAKVARSNNVIRSSMTMGLFALGIFVVGCTASSTAESERTRYDTPESAFEAFVTSGKNGNWKTFANTLTPKSQEMFATIMMFPVAMIASTNKAAEKEAEAIMKRHGMDINGQSDDSDISQIKDKPGFIADVMTFLNKQGDGNSNFDIPDGKLIDLKIKDDTATAMLDDEPIEFKKIDGGWLVHFEMTN